MSKRLYQIEMVSRYRLKGEMWNKRFALTGMIFLLFLYLVEEGILEFCERMYLKVSPWVFPFLSGDWICQMMICGYFLWLVSALAGKRGSDLFVRVRAGKVSWELGNCVAIIKFAALYTVLLVFLSAILLLPQMEFNFKWGKAWNTLASTNAGELFGIGIYVSPMTIHLYNPVKATLYAMLLQFLCLAWLGLLMYMVNLLVQKSIGMYLALAFIFLDVMLSNTSMERYFKFSPVTMVQLSNYSVATLRYGITIRYALLFYLTGIFFFLLISVNFASKKWRWNRE